MADMDTHEQKHSDEPLAADDVANGQMSAEDRAEREKEWREELAKTEEEVDTLKKVLASKQKRVHDLKRMLGIGIVSKLSKDVNEGITRLSESEMMKKANAALNTAGERTSAALSTVSKKLEDVKNSEFVKSFEEKVGSAYDSVKAKVAAKSDDTGAPVPAGTGEEPMTTPTEQKAE